MNYKIALKNPDPNATPKWLNVGNFKLNQWGKMSLGLKVTPELAALILNKQNGEWVNLSAFEDTGERETAPVVQAPVFDDSIPF